MQISLEKIDTCDVRINVECSGIDVKKGYNKAYRKLFKQMKPAGFRKDGPVPKQLVKQLAGQELINEYATTEVLDLVYPAILKQEDIKAYRSGKVESSKIDENQETCSFTAVIPLDPVIELANYAENKDESRFEVKAVTDEDINKMADAIRESARTYKDLTTEALEKGDYAQLELENESGEKTSLNVLVGESAKYLDSEIIGLTPEAGKSAEISFPAEFKKEEWANKTLKVNIKVLNAARVIIPELSDEFVQNLKNQQHLQHFSSETVKEFLDKVRQHLEVVEKNNATDVYATKVLDDILAASSISIPEVLWKEVFDRRMKDIESMLSYQKQTFQQYLEEMKETEESYKANLKEEAVTEVKRALLVREIAKKEGLDVTQQSLYLAVQDIAMENQVSTQAVADRMSNPEMQAEVYYRAIYNTVMEFLRDKQLGK